jgi:hypothetical protein
LCVFGGSFLQKNLVTLILSCKGRKVVRHRRLRSSGGQQGCQMPDFQTKKSNLGKFWRVLQWKMLVYFMSILSTLRPWKIFCGHLVYFVAIWYILWSFGVFFPVLVYCTKKNLATLQLIIRSFQSNHTDPQSYT